VKLYSPSVERNREPIAGVLAPLLASRARILEVASGTGEHAVYLGQRFPHVHLTPSDVSAEARASIQAHVADARLTNVAPPLELDVCAPWPIRAEARFDVILCFNMVHISPWEATLALLAGARQYLEPVGALVLYGPYRERDVPTAASNEAFDESLRARDPRWGLRDVEEVARAAHGLVLTQRTAMPANNLTLVFRRGVSG
jgi:SAM-dependent methyltransferase